jgi:hypothetical protein
VNERSKEDNEKESGSLDALGALATADDAPCTALFGDALANVDLGDSGSGIKSHRAAGNPTNPATADRPMRSSQTHVFTPHGIHRHTFSLSHTPREAEPVR